MSYVLLCKGRRAQKPYVIASLRKKIYTVEELCYYIYDNTVLCGEELLELQLAFWLKNQCGFADLCESIRVILNKDPRPERVASQIFAYTDYLDKAEREAVCEKIRKFSQLSMNERKKMCADHNVLAGHYAEAVRDYEEMLVENRFANEREKHHILYDIGCCYGFMFYYNLAYDWFMKAAELDIQKEDDLCAALFCQKMMLQEDAYEAFLKTHREFEKAAAGMERKEKGIRQEYEKKSEAVALQMELHQARTAGDLHETIEKRLTAYKAEI